MTYGLSSYNVLTCNTIREVIRYKTEYWIRFDFYFLFTLPRLCNTYGNIY